jgi:formate hydrogenlyase subunit 3/multisubunit Na+/H+ antiporter MnhD subunit
MFKRPYVLAVVSFLVIPVVTVLAGMLINSIDPEIAVRTSNYERNFWLLTQAKNLSMLAVLMVIVSLWFLTCFFLVKSKQRSYGWLPLAMLGPFGLIILTLLSDNAQPLRICTNNLSVN